jgi:hypothetical protein
MSMIKRSVSKKIIGMHKSFHILKEENPPKFPFHKGGIYPF